MRLGPRTAQTDHEAVPPRIWRHRSTGHADRQGM